MPRRLEPLNLVYQIEFAAGFHCGTGLPRGLLDRTVQRDARGFIFIPGSTLKGALRDRCEQLARLLCDSAPLDPHAETAEEFERKDLIARLFGTRALPGTLWFDTASLSAEDREALQAASPGQDHYELQTMERTQVSLSRLTGAAKPGLLFSSEFGIPALRFDGRITGHLADVRLDDDLDCPPYGLLLLAAGLCSLDRLGGSQSSGAGQCTVEIQGASVAGRDWPVESLLDRLAALMDAETAWELYS